MWREERPGALAPGSLAGTSRRRIPAWVRKGVCQEIRAMLRRPSVRFQAGKPVAACHSRERVDREPPRRCHRGSEFAAEVGWSRPEAGEPGRDRILQIGSGLEQLRRERGLNRTTNQRPAKQKPSEHQ